MASFLCTVTIRHTWIRMLHTLRLVFHSQVLRFFWVFWATWSFLWSGANCRVPESKISFSLSLTSIFHSGEQEVWGRLEASAVAPSCHYPLSQDVHYMCIWRDEGFSFVCVAFLSLFAGPVDGLLGKYYNLFEL